MQTANFQCGNCGNLMAVGTEFLGQQVRCPHCQQVVVAPPAPAPAPAPSPFQLSPSGEHEDIFSPKSDNEDLFGRPETPRLELPPDPAPSAGVPAPPPGGDGLAAPLSPAGPPAPEQAAAVANPFAAAAPAGEHRPEVDLGPGLASLTRPPRVPSGGGGWFLPLVFLPLLLYAVLATVAAVMLYSRQPQAPPSPFEAMPDDAGDTPGVRKGRPEGSLKWTRHTATADLPEKLRVPLGETLRVGDLEVTPLRVERARKEVITGTYRPEKCDHDSLVLHLRLKNVAADYSFTPLDNYFDRKWKPGDGGSPPLTQLQAGPQRFFGGPAQWVPRDTGRKGHRERVAGRPDYDPDGLQPGEEVEQFVCTDGGTNREGGEAALHLFGGTEPKTGKRVAPYAGPLLWRVHLRRGLFEWKGRRLPAAAVVGVEFTDKDYARRG